MTDVDDFAHYAIWGTPLIHLGDVWREGGEYFYRTAAETGAAPCGPYATQAKARAALSAAARKRDGKP